MDSKQHDKLKVKVVTPEKIILKDFYDLVVLPTMDGQIGILPRHTPLVTALKSGEIKLVRDKEVFWLAVSHGVVEVRPNSSVVILADTAEHMHEIDLERAEKARQRASNLLQNSHNQENVEHAHLQAVLEKQLARIRVAKKYRNKR